MAHKLRKVERPCMLIPWFPAYLTWEDLAEIQRCYVDEDMTYAQIAEATGASAYVVSMAVKAVRADLAQIPDEENERMQKVFRKLGREVKFAARTMGQWPAKSPARRARGTA